MRTTSKVPLAPLIRGALTGWTVLMLVFGSHTLLHRHDPHFAPEVGPAAAFMIFGFFLSIAYLADFALLAIPTYLLLRRRTSFLRQWQWAFCGTELFLLSLVAWSVVYNLATKGELLFWAVLAGPAGAASFYVLAPKRLPI